ncbi:MAG: biotin--[acetyl-CoA-carboxylase] ligase [Pseudomonadota bacterium]
MIEEAGHFNDVLKSLVVRSESSVDELAALLQRPKLEIDNTLHALQHSGFPLDIRDSRVTLDQSALLKHSELRQRLEALDLLASTSLSYSVDSTNAELKRDGERSGWRLAIADYQTQGRGRRGRSWFSSVGEGISMSLSRPISQSALGPVSLVVGTAVVNALMDLGGTRLGLKWPNDLVVADRKLGGILVETQVLEDDLLLVIGIGLNHRLRNPEHLPMKVPIADLSSVFDAGVPSREDVVIGIVQHVVKTVEHSLSQGFLTALQQWQELDCYKGRAVCVHQESKTYFGTAHGIDAEGGFCLKLEDGSTREFSAGEVSLRLAETG